MKNLTNCKPSEFLRQTNRIRKAVAKWLTDTDIMNIRKRMPKLEDSATESEKIEALRAQSKENWRAMLDAILDEHPDETLEVLALICFVEPKDFDKHTVSEYLESLTEMMNDEAVVGFFSSLERWGNTSGMMLAGA